MYGFLGGGQVQLVRIGDILAQKSKVPLIDEPLNNLDIKDQLQIMNILKSFVIEKRIVAIMAIHDLNIALNYADKFLFEFRGSLYFKYYEHDI